MHVQLGRKDVCHILILMQLFPASSFMVCFFIMLSAFQFIKLLLSHFNQECFNLITVLAHFEVILQR